MLWRDVLHRWENLHYDRFPELRDLPLAVVAAVTLEWRRKTPRPNRAEMILDLARQGWQNYEGPLALTLPVSSLGGALGTAVLSPFSTFAETHARVTRQLRLATPEGWRLVSGVNVVTPSSWPEVVFGPRQQPWEIWPGTPDTLRNIAVAQTQDHEPQPELLLAHRPRRPAA